MKKWYQSKTIWVNLIVVALGVVGELSNVLPVSQHPKLWVSVTGILNIALRALTTAPLGTDK